MVDVVYVDEVGFNLHFDTSIRKGLSRTKMPMNLFKSNGLNLIFSGCNWSCKSQCTQVTPGTYNIDKLL